MLIVQVSNLDNLAYPFKCLGVRNAARRQGAKGNCKGGQLHLHPDE
jgi:hypothetical protein